MVAKLLEDAPKISANFLEGGVGESEELEDGCAGFCGSLVCLGRIRGNMEFSILGNQQIFVWVWLLVGEMLQRRRLVGLIWFGGVFWRCFGRFSGILPKVSPKILQATC